MICGIAASGLCIDWKKIETDGGRLEKLCEGEKLKRCVLYWFGIFNTASIKEKLLKKIKPNKGLGPLTLTLTLTLIF